MLAFEVCRSGAAFIACDGLVTRGPPDLGAVRATLPHARSGGSAVPHLVVSLVLHTSNQRFLFAAWGSTEVICEVVTAANMRMLF